MRLFGAAGTPLKAIFVADGEDVTVRSEITLSPASKRPLDLAALRDQFGRLGDTPFVLGAVDMTGVSDGLFLPVSEQNHLRQQAVEQLMLRRDWARDARLAERRTTRRGRGCRGAASVAPAAADDARLRADGAGLSHR